MSRDRTNQPVAAWFNKIPSQHDVTVTSDNSRPHDVEKAEITPSSTTTHEKSVVGAQTTSDTTPESILVQNNASDSDKSTLEALDDKGDFPEGGLRAWLVVLGAFSGSFSVFGIINSTAILLEYFSNHQLQDKSPSQIGWIFGLALFLTFFCGAPIGPIFDAYGPQIPMLLGSVFLLASMFLLGLCTRKCSHHSSAWALANR